MLRHPILISGSLSLALGAGTLLAGVAPLPCALPERLPSAANGRISEILAEPAGSWTIQLLSDIQDGFPYVPRLLREGEEHGARAVVIAGDLATGKGGEHLSLVLRELRSHATQVPLFAVPGNHDEVVAGDEERFTAAFGGRDFQFRIGSTEFFGFDSTDRHGRRLAKRRLRSAIRAAAQAGERMVVVCHHSPLNVAKDGSDGDPRQIDHELLEILRDPTVAFVFSGHVHRERSDLVNGVRFLIAPPSGDKNSSQEQTPVSYLLLRWTGENYVLERHQFPRRNHFELAGTLTHNLLAHAQPWLRGLLQSGVFAVRSLDVARESGTAWRDE